MSYILDALKKSEQQRQALSPEALPAGTATSYEAAGTVGSSSLLVGLILGTVASLLVAAALWVVVAGTESLGEGGGEGIDVADDVSSLTSTPLVSAESGVNDSGVKQKADRAVSQTTAVAVHEVQTIAPATTSSPVVGASTGQAETARRVLPPLSVLKTIPDLIITGHIYSSVASKRSVSMNGRDWSQGDYVSDSIRINTITPDGVIIEVDGWNLPLKRNKGWQAIAD